MNKSDPRDEYQKLPDTIAEAFEKLNGHDPSSEEYAKIVDQITKLTKISQAVSEMTINVFEATNKKEEAHAQILLKADELRFKVEEAQKPDRVSKETWAIVGANLAGIVLIIGHERLSVITTKALGFISKLK